MKMNPICERASRAAARTPRFSASLCGGNALLSAMAVFLLGLMFQRAENTGELRYEEVLGVFHALIWTELALAALLVPASAASAVSGEREQKTLDLLLGTALSPPSIILGNLLQNLITAAIFVFSGLPVLLTALLFGGAGFTDLALLFGGILLSAALAGSLGLFFSALNRTTAVAIVETFAAEALLTLFPDQKLRRCRERRGGSPLALAAQSDGRPVVSRNRTFRFLLARRRQALRGGIGADRLSAALPHGYPALFGGQGDFTAPQKT